MKKITVTVLAVLLTLCFTACGKTNDNSNTATTPTSETSVLPQIDPTMDTNIPDDSVNENSTDTTDATDTTGSTDASTAPAGNGGAASESSRNMK